ncbi:hypothetical protein HA402_002895 [Bradysia odoriphaga]|nr:hypothetical protein HA402_002895 [Bradysia odoriphaga]
MKMIIVFATIVACALAAPVDDPKDATVLKYENDNIGVDGYKFAYETSNGITRSEQAELKNVGTEQEALNVQGSVTWTAPDGQVFTINFVADENGYRPEGAHIPKA